MRFLTDGPNRHEAMLAALFASLAAVVAVAVAGDRIIAAHADNELKGTAFWVPEVVVVVVALAAIMWIGAWGDKE